MLSNSKGFVNRLLCVSTALVVVLPQRICHLITRAVVAIELIRP